MSTVNIHEAKTHLSRLIARVSDGKEIVIAKNGKPVAWLVPYARPRVPRQPGSMRDKIQVADDFDAPLPSELLAGFEPEALQTNQFTALLISTDQSLSPRR